MLLELRGIINRGKRVNLQYRGIEARLPDIFYALDEAIRPVTANLHACNLAVFQQPVAELTTAENQIT